MNFSETVAVHEAGHAILACKAGVRVESVSINNSNAGVCFLERGYQNKISVMDGACIILAGMAAQSLFTGDKMSSILEYQAGYIGSDAEAYLKFMRNYPAHRMLSKQEIVTRLSAMTDELNTQLHETWERLAYNWKDVLYFAKVIMLSPAEKVHGSLYRKRVIF